MIQKYRYQVSVSGDYEYLKGQGDFINELEYRIGASLYNPSSKKDVVFAGLSLDAEGSGQMMLNMDTYIQKFGVSGKHIKQKNLPAKDLDGFIDKAFSYVCGRYNIPGALTRFGNVNYTGPLYEVPDVLYHITSRNKLDDIMANGLIPQRGTNNFSDGRDHVYFADFENIVPWVGILYTEDPVILEINSKDVPGLESGRVYNDRSYTGLFGEWCTLKPVAAECIRRADLNKEQCGILFKNAVVQCEEIQKRIGSLCEPNYSNYEESWSCLQAMWPMGVAEKLNIGRRDPVTYCCNTLDLRPLAAKVYAVEKGDGHVKARPVTTILDSCRKELIGTVKELDNHELCSLIQAHFESHPTLPGEKTMKDNVNRLLKDNSEGDIIWGERQRMISFYADTRIRQISFDSISGITELKTKHTDAGSVLARQGIVVSQADARLMKQEDGTVKVLGQAKDGSFKDIGMLKERTLTNNPMNVNVCDAILQIADYTDGQGKNLSFRLIIDTDEMSGDVIKLDDTMLSALENNDGRAVNGNI